MLCTMWLFAAYDTSLTCYTCTVARSYQFKFRFFDHIHLVNPAVCIKCVEVHWTSLSQCYSSRKLLPSPLTSACWYRERVTWSTCCQWTLSSERPVWRGRLSQWLRRNSVASQFCSVAYFAAHFASHTCSLTAYSRLCELNVDQVFTLALRTFLSKHDIALPINLLPFRSNQDNCVESPCQLYGWLCYCWQLPWLKRKRQYLVANILAMCVSGH